MAELKITIDKEGNSKVEVFGVSGPECKTLTANLENKLGKVIRTTETSEFYEVDQNVLVQNKN